jgi:hypothetical protein
VPSCATLGAEGVQLQFREFTKPQGRSPRLDTFRALDNVDVAFWHARRTHDIDNCACVTYLRWARVYPEPVISFGRPKQLPDSYSAVLTEDHDSNAAKPFAAPRMRLECLIAGRPIPHFRIVPRPTVRANYRSPLAHEGIRRNVDHACSVPA